ncbi:MAG: penicillin-binding transpeptidase domain-containing protein [Candidatus Microgenomates bacterium]|jgi:penicillin-binding protein 2
MKSWLSWFLSGLVILGLTVLIGRVIELQIIKGDYYRNLAEGNRIKRVSIVAPRGEILARGGEVLVGNREVNGVWVRDYPLGSKFAHVGGYVGTVNENEVGKINPKCPEKGPYKANSSIGRSGLEQEYECTLSGIDGEKLVEVDITGKEIRVLGTKPAIPGQDLKTSIDYGFQTFVPDLMQNQKGAIIITDTKGQVLALYSSPSFDPQKVGDYLNDASYPLFDRAIGGLFHPGSTFKPVMAIAGLSEGKIDKDYLYDDVGFINVSIYRYTNWYFTQYGGIEGEINVVKALARSTDTFFYNLGELLGAEKIATWAGVFGLDKITRIDLPGEVAGLIPTPSWKLKTTGEPWFLGNTYNISIGQGDMAVTPIGLNAMISSIASGGYLCTPQVRLTDKPECQKLDIKKEYLDIVREGMVGVCQKGGTGYTFFDFTTPIACKTGTAETSQDGKAHAWFTAFAPVDNPQIVVTVLFEQGGEGSVVAGPVARKIFDFWSQHNQ